jgi:hypothetical protein
MRFAQPIRVRVAGHRQGDLLVVATGERCGPLAGPETLTVRFEEGRGVFVLSLEDLRAAISRAETERWVEWLDDPRAEAPCARCGAPVGKACRTSCTRTEVR